MKGYAREAGTRTVERLLASGTAAISRLSEVEVTSALARQARAGVCTVEERDAWLARLDRELPSFLVVELVPAVTSRARALLNTYALRASDAVQLASCYHLQEELGHDVPFVVVDQRLAAAHESGATVMGTGGEEPE